MSVSVKVVDKGFQRIEREFKKLKGAGVKAGVIGAKRKRGAKITQPELMLVHEYGARINHPGGTPYIVGVGAGGAKSAVTFIPKSSPIAVGLPVTKPHVILIPQRPVMRLALIKNEKANRALSKKLAAKIVEGKIDAKKLLGFMGEKISSDIKRNFGDKSLLKPLRPSTIARRRKQSDQPLVDTGSLRNSITYKTFFAGQSASGDTTVTR